MLSHGKMPAKIRAQLHALYDPFVARLYTLIEQLQIAVSPCEHRGTRFLDDPEYAANASVGGKRPRAVANDDARRR